MSTEDQQLNAVSGTAVKQLIEHIQTFAEHQKALLARELHDELGGLLVGAVMDLAWAEQHLSAPPLELKQKLTRARQTLSAAIDLKRKLIEELRPTLLDNVGLFAALRWHAQSTCKRIGLACVIHIPEEESRFSPNIPIALFRIVQEAFAVIVAPPAASAELNVALGQRALSIQLSNEATTSSSTNESKSDSDFRGFSVAAVGQRVAALGGEFKLLHLAAGGLNMTASFPVESVLAPA